MTAIQKPKKWFSFYDIVSIESNSLISIRNNYIKREESIRLTRIIANHNMLYHVNLHSLFLELSVQLFSGVGVDTTIAAVVSSATGGGGDFGNKPIPTITNNDNPMNINSYLALKIVLLLNMMSPSLLSLNQQNPEEF